MRADRETRDEESWALSNSRDVPTPGVMLIYSAGKAFLRVIPLVRGSVHLGREDTGGIRLDDERVSREHAQVQYDGARWTVRDLDSRNGTFVDGVEIPKEAISKAPRTLRMGHSVFVFTEDVRPYLGHQIEVSDKMVAGPTLKGVLDRVQRAAQSGDSLLITGESGSGKELAARAFHEAGPRSTGPFVPVNCAAIPEGVAERLLFGAKKGAFSGATADVDGYVQAADGGTLFLDEIGELDMSVQAKLLRVLEAREVLQLGASRGRPVDLRFCSATHRDLRGAIAGGSFRADLFFRIGQPDVRLPPLRERPEEMSYLIVRELRKVDGKLSAHGKLVEACALRPWPGNIRELLGEIRRAANDALAAGSPTVRVEHLGDKAGMQISKTSDAKKGEAAPPTKEEIEAALAAQNGNVAAAARALSVHRTQLYRWMKRFGIKSTDKKDDEDE